MKERGIPKAKQGTEKWKDFVRNKDKIAVSLHGIHLIWQWMLNNFPQDEEKKTISNRNVIPQKNTHSVHGILSKQQGGLKKKNGNMKEHF